MRKLNARNIQLIDKVSTKIISIIIQIGEVVVLLGKLISKTFKLFFQPLKFKNFYIQPILEQMVRLGVNSIPVVLTTALFTGMVLAVQSGITLEEKIKGSAMFVGSIVNLSLVRELGPILTAILVTGRVGSAMAAEIGSMKITGQIDALRTLATNPVEYIGVPRFLAMLVMLPLLTIMANVFGSLGGWLIATLNLEISSIVYWQGAQETVGIGDVFSGIFKSIFFAIIISVLSLYRGFTTEGGARGVGKSTTGAVVNTSITILIFDYFLTQFLAWF